MIKSNEFQSWFIFVSHIWAHLVLYYHRYCSVRSIIWFMVWVMNHFIWLIRRCKLHFELFLCSPFVILTYFSHSRFPLKWRTPFGYLVAFLIESGAAFAAISSFIPMLSFLSGSCLLFVSFIKDTTADLWLFNVTDPKKSDNKVKVPFFNIIQMHSELKELSWNTRSIESIGIKSNVKSLQGKENNST